MPIRSLIDPKTLQAVPLEEAPDYFERKGLMPAEVIGMILKDEGRPPAGRPFVYPSVADPDVTCRREVLIRQHLPYDLNPIRLWQAKEGTIWHDAFLAQGAPGWEHEVNLPDALLVEGRAPGGGNVKVCSDGKPRLEVWPGVWMRGRVDRHQNWDVLADHKTTRYAKQDYGLKKDWTVRLNIYARMVWMLRGVAPKELWVWRTYRGVYEPEKAFRRFPVPLLGEGDMSRLGQFALSLQGYLEKAETTDDVEALVRSMPMDGEKMFNGKKCGEYCAVKDVCFRIQGLTMF